MKWDIPNTKNIGSLLIFRYYFHYFLGFCPLLCLLVGRDEAQMFAEVPGMVSWNVCLIWLIQGQTDMQGAILAIRNVIFVFCMGLDASETSYLETLM